eukprot:1515017-Pyramimonas_sp.AAC.1
MPAMGPRSRSPRVGPESARLSNWPPLPSPCGDDEVPRGHSARKFHSLPQVPCGVAVPSLIWGMQRRPFPAPGERLPLLFPFPPNNV